MTYILTPHTKKCSAHYFFVNVILTHIMTPHIKDCSAHIFVHIIMTHISS